MLALCDDTKLKISSHLNDHEKISLTGTCTIMNKLKYKLIYCSEVNVRKISKLPYFDNFENIIMSLDCKIPKKAKYVHHTAYARSIPTGVTHLTFSDNFDRSIKAYIYIYFYVSVKRNVGIHVNVI